MTTQEEPLARFLALKRVLEEHEKAGTLTVPTSSVLHHVRVGVEKLLPVFQTPKEASIEKYKTELKVWEAEHQYRLDWSLENFRQTISFAQTATKYIVLIHGGAAVALLGFLARVWQPGAGDAVRPFANSVVWFASGLFLAAFAALLSYVVQLLYGATKKWTIRCATGLHILAFVIVLSTFVTLERGIAAAYGGFVTEEIALELREERTSTPTAPGGQLGGAEEERTPAANAGPDTGAATDTAERIDRANSAAGAVKD